MDSARNFEYKEVDLEGAEILDVVGSANLFNRWMYNTIKGDCTKSVLEIGSGLGNISKYFIEDNADITLSDIRDNYCSFLSDKFKETSIVKMNLTDPNFDDVHADLIGTFDSVFALNVVEHIEDHVLALENVHKLLKPGGQVVILVPAFQTLYNTFDTALEHYRRYTRKSLTELISKKYKIQRSQYFNAFGILGWFVNGNILKKTIIPKGQMKLYNYFIPISKIIDKLLLNKIGLSVIVVGKKEA